MENPIHFDVWAQPLVERRELVLSVLQHSTVYSSELEARKLINSALQSNSQILTAKSLTYSDAQQFIKKNQSLFKNLALFQEGYSPGETRNFCSKHLLHYGGCLGCHICNEFYAR